MSLTQELAQEIWSSGQFRADLTRLEGANVAAELPRVNVTGLPAELDEQSISRLLQSALIFSSAETDELNEVAQRISTAVYRLFGAADEVAKDIFTIIQARLRNFPALMAGQVSTTSPQYAPLTLQYEFAAARNSHTIFLGDRSEHLMTPFQLESWKALTSQRSTTLTGPTSAGKSYVLMIYLTQQFQAHSSKIIVYIVPTRALINQVADDAAAALSQAGIIDVNVTTIPVDVRAPEGISKGPRAPCFDAA